MSQALIDLDLFDPGGCETPPLPFNPEQIEVIKKVVSGEAFENPISGAVNGALNGLNNAFSKLNDLNLDEDQLDALSTSGLADALQNASSIVTDFSNHSDRLSGVLDSDGEVPGLAGLNSLAKSFNNVKNAIDGNPAEAVIDHYSAMFSGILGPGSSAFNAVNALIDGDLQQVLGELDAFDGDGDGFPNLSSIVNSVTDLQNDITNIINGDNDFALAAVDYLAKVSLGTSVLQMAEDPCFGQKLLQQIGSPDIKGLLNL